MWSLYSNLVAHFAVTYPSLFSMKQLRVMLLYSLLGQDPRLSQDYPQQSSGFFQSALSEFKSHYTYVQYNLIWLLTLEICDLAA